MAISVGAVSAALLLLRLVSGLTLAAHGAQKLFGWFGGAGFAKFAQGIATQGLRPGALWTTLAVVGELGGGLSLAFGLLTPLGATGAVGAMAMVIGATSWKNGFWNSNRGYEFPLTLLAASAAIGVAGAGQYSLDGLLGIQLPELALFLGLTVAALVVDFVGLAIKRAAPSAPAQRAPGAS